MFLSLLPLLVQFLHEEVVVPVTQRTTDVDLAGGLPDVVRVRDVIGDLDVREVVEEALAIEPVQPPVVEYIDKSSYRDVYQPA